MRRNGNGGGARETREGFRRGEASAGTRVRRRVWGLSGLGFAGGEALASASAPAREGLGWGEASAATLSYGERGGSSSRAHRWRRYGGRF